MDEWAESAPRHRSRKNTRRWCRGKPGVEHEFRRLTWHQLPNRISLRTYQHDTGECVLCRWLFDVCEQCGKQLMVTR